MRKFVLLLIGLGILTIGLTSAIGHDQKKGRPKQGNEASRGILPSLPGSLDALYPPQAGQPIFLLKMFAIDTSYGAIAADLVENKLKEAKADFERFKAQYLEIAKMVPEWNKNYNMSPVNELEAALKSGERRKVMMAWNKVVQVCHNCHISHMAIVQQKYHWGNFDALSIEDPLTNKKVTFRQLNRYLMVNFSGMSVDVERGQKGGAQKQFRDFNTRFQAMKVTCGGCHDTERKYYVDEGVQALVDKLGNTLSKPSLDPKAAESLRQRIGMESCTPCHRVHIPAAYAQENLKKNEKGSR